MMHSMDTLTITLPRSVLRHEDLVVIPRKELDALIERAADAVSEKDILRWSREARALKRAGKLPMLRSLRAL